MVAVPLQRPSPDLRTVMLSHVSAVAGAVIAARRRGWRVVSATRDADRVQLVLTRSLL